METISWRHTDRNFRSRRRRAEHNVATWEARSVMRPTTGAFTTVQHNKKGTNLFEQTTPAPADHVSHRSQDIPEQQVGRKTQLHSELIAQVVLCSLTCQAVLHLPPLILFCQRGYLSFYPLRAGSISASPAPLSTQTRFFSFTHSVSSILSFYAFILAFPVKVLSMMGSGSLSAFVIMWLCRSCMRCKRRATRTTSSVSMSFNVRRQNVEISWLNFRR